MIRKLLASTVLSLLAAGAAGAQNYPGQAQFRELYKEMVETNTTLSSGSCTEAAEKVAVRLKAAGYADSDIRILAPQDRPKSGALIAELRGTDAKLKPILLLAHIDVVEANRADWERDPFTLIEEGGYFYARGSSDDKAMGASLADAMIRYKTESFKPRRGLKLALTCGEESFSVFNSVDWLLKTQPAVLDAAFALNEGASGLVEGDRRVYVGIQAGEKLPQTFDLTVVNPGGHSSMPLPDNAIYRMGAALARIGAYDFPAKINEATRLHFERLGPIIGGELGAGMSAAVKSPDAATIAAVAKDPTYNSMMRTTCVATEIKGGHAVNALPQRVDAAVNCRILPGETVEETQAALAKVINDPQVTIAPREIPSPASPPPPLTPAILGPAEKVANEMWPGLPLVPAMSTGATDSRFLLAAGIPAYGLSGMLREATGTGTHGLNERIRVRSLYEGREFLYRVVKLYANAKP